MALVLIGLATFGIGATLIRRAETPPWMQQNGSAWV
jgi:hypothetical protein